MWVYPVLIILSLLCQMVFLEDSTLEDEMRTKRQINSLPLVFPYGATYKFIVGFSSPVPTKDDLGLTFAVNFQYQYSQFTNITQLSQYYVYNEISREQREADWAARKDERLTFYRALADLLNTKGFNGMECVLRAICEAAQYPVEEEGLVGELIHILLTLPSSYTRADCRYSKIGPVGDELGAILKVVISILLASTFLPRPDYGRTPFDDEDPSWEEAMSIYKDAAIAGRQMFSCSYIYNGCPEGQGVMEFISVLRDE